MGLKDIYRTRIEGKLPKEIKIILSYDDGSESTIEYQRDYPLRYGTNPHQASGDYSLKDPILTLKEIKTGKSGMSQTNMEDIVHGCEIVKYFTKPTFAVMKHLNPCGVAESDIIKESFEHSMNCDLQAAFGGVCVSNKPIDLDTAHNTEGKYIEVIGAPDFDEGVMDVFNKRKDLRVMQLLGIDKLPYFVGDNYIPNIKSYAGKLFLETPYLTKINLGNLRNRDMNKLPAIVSKRDPTEQEFYDMLFTWYVCGNVRSNGIVIGKKLYTVAIGTGQQDRVTAVRQAIAKNKYLHENDQDDTFSLNNSVIASDGLFPFSDSIEACGEVGISAIIQPGGSVKDDEIIKAADKYNMAMVFTGERCFAH